MKKFIAGIFRKTPSPPAPEWTKYSEPRRSLEKNIPGITIPFEFGYFDEFSYLTQPVTVTRRGRDGRGFLVFMPHYFPDIFFGGHAAFFKFLAAIKREHGGDLKLVIIKQNVTRQSLDENIARIKKDASEAAGLFSDFNLLVESRSLEVDGQYGVISFCSETHFVASSAASQLNVAPIFFIPEYEPDFHGPGSLKTFVRSTFDLPHIGLFNTRKLYEYFRHHTDIAQMRDLSYRYVIFENEIKPMPWSAKTFQARHAGKKKRRVIVYARPESLGARNELGIALLALKRCIELKYFDESSWSFSGIGALIGHRPMPLSQHSQLEIVPKLPMKQYEEHILGGDVGISLISTPHPGIVHYQMANFGLATVTYAHLGRSPEWLKTQSRNLIPSEMTLDGLRNAIKEAIDLSADIDARYRNAAESVQYESAEATIAKAAKDLLTAGFRR